jgi:hypothetical protein
MFRRGPPERRVGVAKVKVWEHGLVYWPIGTVCTQENIAQRVEVQGGVIVEDMQESDIDALTILGVVTPVTPVKSAKTTPKEG